MNYVRESGDLANLASVLKLDQQFKPEEMYIKDVSIKDKNELINSINKIYRNISRSAETMEYIYSNNFQFNNKGQNDFSSWSKSEVLYKLGKNSPYFQKSTSLYYNLLSSIQNYGNDIKKDPDDNEDVETKNEEKTLREKDIKERINNTNSLCDDFEKALKEYNMFKKEKEMEKNRMEIEIKNEDDKKKKVSVDKVVMVFEDEKACLDKLTNFGKLF